MEYLIDKVNQEEAKQIYEIIDFFEKNPTITKENVNTYENMLIEFNGLIQKYDNHTSKYSPVSHIMLSVYQQKWNSDTFCSRPPEPIENFVIYMKHSAFGEKHDNIIQLEEERLYEERLYLNSSPFLVRLISKIRSFFKKSFLKL